jgi:hypothetical protein
MAQAHRTYWIVRQRYRRIGLISAVAAGLATGAFMTPHVHSAEWTLQGDHVLTFIEALAGLLLATLIPLVAARLLWRLHRRRFYEDIYQIKLR